MKSDKQTILSLGAIVLAGVFSYTSIEATDKKEEAQKNADYLVKSEKKQGDIKFVDLVAMKNTDRLWVEWKAQGDGVTVTSNDAKSLKESVEGMPEEKRAKITVKITLARAASPEVSQILKKKYKIKAQGENTVVMGLSEFNTFCVDGAVLGQLKNEGSVFQVKGKKEDLTVLLPFTENQLDDEVFGLEVPVGRFKENFNTTFKAGDTIYVSGPYKEGAYDLSGKLKWEHRHGVLTLHNSDLIDKALATLKERNSTASVNLTLSNGDDVRQMLDDINISYKIRDDEHLEAPIASGVAADLIRDPNIRNHLIWMDISDSGIEEEDFMKLLFGAVSQRTENLPGGPFIGFKN